MTFNKFQKECLKNSAFPYNPLFDLRYWALALAGEAGEVADEVKKCIRDENFVLTQPRKELMFNEMANTLYYLSRMASELNVTLESIADRQIELCLLKKAKVEQK